MVRIKHRYILVHILYPDLDSNWALQTGARGKALPDIVQIHRPSPDYLEPALLARALRDQVQLLYGDYGLGLVSSSLNVKYLSTATSTAIIRCARAHYRLVWAALSFMTHLPRASKSATAPRPCVMQVVRISGTIRKAEEEAIRRARATILRVEKASGEDSQDNMLGLLDRSEHEPLKASQLTAGRLANGSVVSDEEDEDIGQTSDDGG